MSLQCRAQFKDLIFFYLGIIIFDNNCFLFYLKNTIRNNLSKAIVMANNG